MSYQLLEENLDARVENSLKISFSHFRFLFLYLRHVVLHESLADFLCQKKKRCKESACTCAALVSERLGRVERRLAGFAGRGGGVWPLMFVVSAQLQVQTEFLWLL